MRTMGTSTMWVLATLGIAAACSSAGGISGSGGTGPGGGNDNGAGNGTGNGTGGSTGGFDLDGSTSGDASCNHLEIPFVRQTPTVLLLVDQSTSMWDQSFWEPLKTAVLSVVSELQAEFRFGFAAYSGNAQQCPLISGDPANIQLGNYETIASAYNGVVRPDKGETPTPIAIERVTPTLVAFTEEGPKTLLLVTDGQPDFCDENQCAGDRTVAAVQAAYAQGVGTLVVSLGDESAYAAHLNDLANAGAGLGVPHPTEQQMYACYGGPTGTLVGTYVPPEQAGTARFVNADTDTEALKASLRSLINGVRSCVFDLEGQIEVDLANAGLGTVLIDGEPVTYDSPDGWRMNSATQLEVVGEACNRLKNAQDGIAFDFPCEIVIVR